MLTGAAKFIIDVKTVVWGVGFIKDNKRRYGTVYLANARLIDIQTKAVIAEERCGAGSGNSKPPTYDEMLANEALFIKKELAAATDACVKTLKAEMLAL